MQFAALLDRVAAIDPEMRVRFTSPHPKDFPDEVLEVIARRPNVCNCLHMPAQSGNTRTLENMARGYTREAYLNLIDRVKAKIPGCAVTTDIIVGFCRRDGGGARGHGDADGPRRVRAGVHVRVLRARRHERRAQDGGRRA